MLSLVPTKLHAEDALDAIRDAHGNLRVAYENTGAGKGEFADALKDNLSDLKKFMEALSVIELLETMPVLHKIFVENLTSLEPQDAVNAYLGVMKLIGTSVAPDKALVNINVNELLWKHVPRELQALMIEGELAQ